MAPVSQAWRFRPVISALGWRRRNASLEPAKLRSEDPVSRKERESGEGGERREGKIEDGRRGVGRGEREGRGGMRRGEGPVFKTL